MATSVTVSPAAADVAGSCGCTPNNMLDINRESQTAAPRPTAAPMTTGRMPTATTERSTARCSAPSARRTPISGVRRAIHAPTLASERALPDEVRSLEWDLRIGTDGSATAIRRVRRGERTAILRAHANGRAARRLQRRSHLQNRHRAGSRRKPVRERLNCDGGRRARKILPVPPFSVHRRRSYAGTQGGG